MIKISDLKDWKDGINQVICGDSLELMKMMPDKCIDLVLTDPPYGIGIDGQKFSISKNPKHNRKHHEFMGWDNKPPKKEMFDEIFRISKNQIIFGANYFIEHLRGGHKGWIFWYKGQEGLTMSDGEIIYTSFDCPTRMITVNRVELLKDYSQHPTQKPRKLIEKILSTLSKDGETIFDPFMGSWTTARACKDLGRNFLGCELEERYCAIGEERLRQSNLF